MPRSLCNLTVYRGEGDSTNGGISSRRGKDGLLVELPGFHDSEGEPDLELRIHGGEWILVPFGAEIGATMFGGNFGWSSDSRWRSAHPAPLRIHDRVEAGESRADAGTVAYLRGRVFGYRMAAELMLSLGGPEGLATLDLLREAAELDVRKVGAVPGRDAHPRFEVGVEAALNSSGHWCERNRLRDAALRLAQWELNPTARPAYKT